MALIRELNGFSTVFITGSKGLKQGSVNDSLTSFYCLMKMTFKTWLFAPL